MLKITDSDHSPCSQPIDRESVFGGKVLWEGEFRAGSDREKVADGESGESSEDNDLLDSLCVRRGESVMERDTGLSPTTAYLGIFICSTAVFAQKVDHPSCFTRIRICWMHVEEISVGVFRDIIDPAWCLHSLLPPPRSTAITCRLRSSQILPKVYTRSRRYCSFIQHCLNHYQ